MYRVIENRLVLDIKFDDPVKYTTTIGIFKNIEDAYRCAIDVSVLRSIRIFVVNKYSHLEEKECKDYHDKNYEKMKDILGLTDDQIDDKRIEYFINPDSDEDYFIYETQYDDEKNYDGKYYIVKMINWDYLQSLEIKELMNLLDKIHELNEKIHPNKFDLRLGNGYTGDPLPCTVEYINPVPIMNYDRETFEVPEYKIYHE